MKTLDIYGNDVTATHEVKIYDPEGNEVYEESLLNPGWYCVEIPDVSLDEIEVKSPMIITHAICRNNDLGPLQIIPN